MAYTRADKDGLLPLDRDDIHAAPDLGNTASIDIDSANIARLYQDVAANLQRPQPSTWLGQIFYKWNYKPEEDRIAMLSSVVSQAQSLSKRITEFKAEAFLTEQRFKIICFYDLKIAQAEKEMSLRQAQLTLKELDLDHQYKYDEKDLLLKERAAAIDKTIAETENIRERTKRDTAIRQIIESIVDNFDVVKGNSIIMGWMLEIIVGAKSDKDISEMEINQLAKDWIAERKKAEAEKHVHEAKKADLDNQMAELNVRAKRDDYEQNKVRKPRKD